VKAYACLVSFLVVAPFWACSANSARDENRVGGGSSGGGNGGTSAGGSSGAGSGGILINDAASAGDGEAECGGQTFPLIRKPAKILLVLDRSGSMQDPPDGAAASTRKWDLVVPAVNQVITQTDAQVSWGMKSFPEGSGTYCAVTDVIDVPIAAKNAGKVTAAVTGMMADGDGTPTGQAMRAATKYLTSLDAAGDTDQKYILLATDGEPSCVNGQEVSQATARPDAVAAVTEAVTAGYHTFVVGVSTNKTAATQALNDMAVAGQEPRGDPNPLATKFYLANTKDELVKALSDITGVVLDCRFDLTDPPEAGEHVGVRLGSDRIPPDFWSWTPDKKSIEVSGEWCEKIKSGGADSVRVVYGCPTDPIY
jgi:hypothetical protein